MLEEEIGDRQLERVRVARGVQGRGGDQRREWRGGHFRRLTVPECIEESVLEFC